MEPVHQSMLECAAKKIQVPEHSNGLLIGHMPPEANIEDLRRHDLTMAQDSRTNSHDLWEALTVLKSPVIRPIPVSKPNSSYTFVTRS